jgi:ATP-binding cassette, subfamily B, bacterial MsbA
VVSQDTFLFNAPITENIAFGTPGATLQQIQAACAAAQAAGFIESLPDGYDTLVGERGYRLSGGQRQRLSLARAILRDPELLILDEATSALDSQSERLVQQAIERFERNHTVLVIAHRLSTIVGADQILVVEAGRVVQRGTHPSLLAETGLYQRLWQQQSTATPVIY